MPRESGVSTTLRPLDESLLFLEYCPLEPVIGLADGETRWRVMTGERFPRALLHRAGAFVPCSRICHKAA